MAATVQWLFKGQVLYTRFFDMVSLEDIAQSGIEGLALLNESPHYERISLILDAKEVLHYPRNLKALRNVLNPPLLGRTEWMILISEDYFQQHIAQIFSRLFQTRFHPASSLKEAYQFLQYQLAVPAPQHWPESSLETIPLR